MAKKYKLMRKQLVKFTDLSGNDMERKMYRIKALRDIPHHNVKAGDLGGWVSNKSVLSHGGNCWIGSDAKVYIRFWRSVSAITDNALVTDQAVVYMPDNAFIQIYENAIVENNAKIFNADANLCSRIHGHARLSENAVAKNSKYITGSITGNASVVAGSVLENSHVSDNAKVIEAMTTGRARVAGKASVTYNSRVMEDAFITDDAIVKGAEIRGNAIISGSAKVNAAIVCEKATVTGRAVIFKDAVIAGESIIKDDAIVSEGAKIIGKSIISGNTTIDMYEKYTNLISDGNRILAALPDQKELSGTVFSSHAENSLKTQRTRIKLSSLEDEISAYGNDIVKLLKFPIMSDLRDENTLEMMLALKNAKSIEPETNPQEFDEAVKLLERKFMKAESNALIIASTAFSDEQRKKSDKARDLFAIACNDASSEQEKKNAFKQGFRQLEGVVAITDSVVENMRIKVGIPELEA